VFHPRATRVGSRRAPQQDLEGNGADGSASRSGTIGAWFAKPVWRLRTQRRPRGSLAGEHRPSANRARAASPDRAAEMAVVCLVAVPGPPQHRNRRIPATVAPRHPRASVWVRPSAPPAGVRSGVKSSSGTPDTRKTRIVGLDPAANPLLPRLSIYRSGDSNRQNIHAGCSAIRADDALHWSRAFALRALRGSSGRGRGPGGHRLMSGGRRVRHVSAVGQVGSVRTPPLAGRSPTSTFLRHQRTGIAGRQRRTPSAIP